MAIKYENEILTTVGKIGDCIVLSTLWTVCSLPVVTMGAATSALYHTLNKVIRRERSTMWKEYWSSFRENFKQSTVIFLIFLAVIGVIGAGLVISYRLAPTDGVFAFSTVVLYILLNVSIVSMFFNLFYAARFVFPTGKILKNCFLISLLNVGWFLLMWVVLVLAPFELFILINPHPVFFVLAIPSLPAATVLILTFICEKIFKKYMSKEDLEQQFI